MVLLKILNPIIWLFNMFKYFAHVDMQRLNDEYEAYDFNQDTKYF